MTTGAVARVPQRPRLQSIDIMRAIAIAMMIICHAVTDWAPNDGSFVHLIGDMITGDFAAAIFALAAGASQQIWMSRGSSRPRKKRSVRSRVCRRAAFLIILGLVLSLIEYAPDGGLGQVFVWDILPFLGISTLVLYFIRRWPTWSLILLACVIFAVAPIGRFFSGYMLEWSGSFNTDTWLQNIVPNIYLGPAGEHIPLLNPVRITLGVLLNGAFPLLPFLVFPVVGFIIMRHQAWLAQRAHIALLGVFALVSLGAGLAIALMSADDFDPDTAAWSFWTPLSLWPDSPSMLLVQLGVCLLLFSCLRPIDLAQTRLFVIPNRLSRYSLTIYCAHLLIIYWTAYTIGFLRSGDISDGPQGLFAPAGGLIAGLIMIIGFALVTKLWDRIDGKYSMEWLFVKLT